jgi:hypothetical protein
MLADETTFPMDVTDEDPSSRPWNYRPEGYLVEILADIQEEGGPRRHSSRQDSRRRTSSSTRASRSWTTR